MRDGEGTTASAGNMAAFLLAIVSLVLLTAWYAGGIGGWWALESDLGSLVVAGTMLAFLALGPLILWKANGNRVGFAFSAIGLGMLLAGFSAVLSERGLIVFQAVGGAFWLGWIMGIGLLVLWFPTGRVHSRRWIWVQWLGVALVVLTFFSYTFTEQICVGEGDTACSAWTDNPIGIPGVSNPEYGWISGPILTIFALFMGAALVSMIVRYRRAETIERLQLKWFLLACLAFVIGLVAELVLGLVGIPEPPALLEIWIGASIMGVPIAATLAIFRYHLYDIDRIISRTVSYAIVIAVLAAVYVVGLTGLTSLLDSDSPLAVAAVTLAAAGLFNPLRKRVQAFVDHRFNRTRYDAERVMAGFTGSLRDEVDPGTVVGGWVDVVSETMRPVSAGVWLRDGR